MTLSLMDRLSASLGGGDRLSVTGVLLLAGLLVLPAQAQESIQFAPRIGASIATVRSDTAANTRSKTSIMGGVALRVPLPGPLSLQPELLISPKGADIEGEEGGEVRFSAVYTVVPVQVRADLPAIQMVTPHVSAGGFGAVKIYEQQSIGGGRVQVPTDFDQSFYHRFDAGVTAGAGATWDRLGLSVRYSRGLVDVVQDLDMPPFEEAPRQRPPGDGTSAAWTVSLSFGL